MSGRGARARPGTAAAYRVELRKLRAQWRTWLGLGAVVAVPVVFVIAVVLDREGGNPELPFGPMIRESGLATPLLSLSFGAFWLIPLVTALVAGDIVASEDQQGTLKTILTRSVQRRHVWQAKALATATYAVASLTLFLSTGLVAGVLAWGFEPLRSLSGGTIDPERGLALIAASGVVYALPMLAFAAIGLLLSTVTRNSAASVVGTLLLSVLSQLLEVLGLFGALSPYLVTSQFEAWQGLLIEPIDWAPAVRAGWVSVCVVGLAVALSLRVFLRRDVTSG